jgi:predicted ATPase/class 3 adenylate cyclase
LCESEGLSGVDRENPQVYTPKFLADKILSTRSSIEGERKLVTVLFADVSQYTAMSESLDPEEVHQIMDGCFKILMDEIHMYEGTVNQFTGDGIMALFGAPLAHEDHAQRACHAALSMQKALVTYRKKILNDYGVEFRMRIGLNSGPVVVGSIGDDLRMDYTAIGDTTNLAARLESIAKPGAILLSANTHKLIQDYFEFEPIADLNVKGKKEAQIAYNLTGATKVETRIEAAVAKGLTKFVGRSKEIKILKEAYEKAKSGSGQVVGVVGEAGVGKSRLNIELQHFLPEGECTYLEGRSLHYGRAMAYLPILDILRSFFDIQENDNELVIQKKLHEGLLRIDEQFKSKLSSFQSLLSIEVSDDKYSYLDSGQKRVRIFEAIRDLFIRESEQRPLVLAIEDLHWIDKTSEEFLSYLIDWLANARILLILLYRPEYSHNWGNKSYYSKIGVNQLSPDNSAELIKAVLEGGEVVPDLNDLILGKAGGNPFFVEELTHSLKENGLIQVRDHRNVLNEKVSEILLPDTIQGIISARIDRTEEKLKQIMQVASVVGREFAFRILKSIMGMSEELKSRLLELQGLEFISEKRLFPELEYIFKHALTQEVAYNSLLKKRRKEIHEKIGDAIQLLYSERLEEYYELLAYHYGHGDNSVMALEYLEKANQKSIGMNAMQEAISFFKEAMQLLDTLPYTEENQHRRISLLAKQFFAFRLLNRAPELYDILLHYEPTALGLQNKGVLGAFYVAMGYCEYAFGDYDKSINSLTKGIELCKKAGYIEEATAAYAALEMVYNFTGFYDQVFKLKKEILLLLEQRFNPRLYVQTLVMAADSYLYLGRWQEALKECQKALDIAQEYSNDSLISLSTAVISMIHRFRGDQEQALKYSKLAVEKAPTPLDKLISQTAYGAAYCHSDEPKKGVELLEEMIPIYRSAKYIPMHVSTVIVIGLGHWRTGSYDQAKLALDEGLALAKQYNMRFLIGYAHYLLGEVEFLSNKAEAAVHFEKSINVLEGIKAESILPLSYAGYGRCHQKQGNMIEAHKYLAKALEMLDRLGTLIEPERIRNELVELPKI